MENQMQMITDVKIDLYGEVQYYMVSAKQGDKATRYIRVQLMNNGNEFQIPDSVRMIANIKKPDGKFCYNECVKADNRVMVQLTNQALAAAGTAYCDIEMRSRDGELILSSAAFTIEIEPSMRNEDAIESSNEMTYLDSKIQEHINNMLETKQKLEEAFELIKKGAFPGTIFLEPGENVDQYDMDGIYYFPSPVNGPNGGNGWCMVFRFQNASYAKQIWFCEGNTGKIRQVDTYTRTKAAGAWQPWGKFLMKGDAFPALAKGPNADDDLNNYVEDGLWYFANDGKKRANMPPGCTDGYLVSFRADASHKKHLFFQAGTKGRNSWQMYERSYTYVGPNLYDWTDWTRTVTKADPEGRMLSGYLDPAEVTAPGWLRVAKFHDENPADNNVDVLGAAPYPCLISIKRTYSYQNTEEYLIRLDSKYQYARLSQMYGYGDSQLITKVRLVVDTVAHELYLDIYYNYSNHNPILISFMDANVHGGWWEATPFLVVAGSNANWTILSNLTLKKEFFLDQHILDAADNSIISFSYSKPGLSASEFGGWLAAWNGREMRAMAAGTVKDFMNLGNVDNTSDSSKHVNSAAFLKGWEDTRSTPTTPNDYNKSFRIVGIKNKDAIGVTDGSLYATVIGIRGWNDPSGGRAHEFALTSSGNIYHRAGETTEWGEWRRIAWSTMIPTALSSFTNDLEKVKLVPESGSWIQGMQVNRAAVAIKYAATTDSYYPAMTMQLKDGHVGTIGMCSATFGLWAYKKGRTANGTDAAFYFDFIQNCWCVGPALKGALNGNADTATALTSSAGSATKPVYFSGGKPVACTHSLEKSVPANAVFTDTNTWRPVQNNLTSTSTTDALSAAQGRALANGSARDSTKLPLAGGTMTGALNMNGQQVNLASDAYIFAGANVFIGSSRSGAVVQTRSAGGLAVLNATGAAYVHVLASAFTVSSSRKVKEHIREMTEERARKVLEYQVVTFDYIGDDTPNDCDGMIAEDIDEIYKYPVSRVCEGEIIGLDYSKFVPQLIKMVQLQEKRIDRLTAIVEKQGKEIAELKALL